MLLLASTLRTPSGSEKPMTVELTDLQQRLVDTGHVLLVSKTSVEIPEKDRLMVSRGFAGSFGNKGVACTILRDDGRVVIVTEGDIAASVLRHEFIHAAQCFAGEEAMGACLAAAADVGRPLVEAIHRSIGQNPETRKGHRDLETTEALWRNHAAGKALSPDLIDFAFFQDLYPTKETAALAVSVLGFDYPRGAYAALTAHVCAEAGYHVDPRSDLAREIVAYTFEMLDAGVVDDLMVEAIEIAAARAIEDTGFTLTPAGP
jgi:hypothetical protein